MTYKIVWAKKRVDVIYSGDSSEAEVLNAVIEIQSDYRFDSMYQAFHDFSQCRSLAAHPDALEEMVAQNIGAAMSNSKLRIAVVADKPDVLGMLERFESLGLSPYPLSAFDNAESALAWLECAPA